MGFFYFSIATSVKYLTFSSINGKSLHSESPGTITV